MSSSISPTAPVKTAKVIGRRAVKFATLDDILADAERCARGPVRQLGNWSVGQATAHLARAMLMAVDGDPRRAPLPVRLVVRLLRRRILTKGVRPGFKLPKEAADKYIADPTVSAEQGLNELRASIQRLKTEPQRHSHPVLGRMTRDEWNLLQLRHAELHLSFFVQG